MELNTERKQEIVYEVVDNENGSSNTLVINKQKTSLNVDEINLVKNILGKFATINENENELSVKNIDEMLSQAHQVPELNKVMSDSTLKMNAPASVLLTSSSFAMGMSANTGLVGAYAAEHQRYLQLNALLNHEFGLENKVDKTFEVKDKEKAVGVMAKIRHFFTATVDEDNNRPKV